jgi:hypothetical protein
VENSSHPGWKPKRITRQHMRSQIGGKRQGAMVPNPAWGVLPIESAKQRRLTRGIDNPLHSQQVNVGDPVAAFASHSADRPSLTKGGRFAVSRWQTRRQTVLVSASARCHPSPRHSLGRCLGSTRSPGRRVRSLHSRTLALGFGLQRFQRIRRSKSRRAKERRQPSATVCPPAAQPLRPMPPNRGHPRFYVGQLDEAILAPSGRFDEARAS